MTGLLLFLSEYWLMGIVAGFLVLTATAGRALARAQSIDAVGLTLIALLAVIGAREGKPVYLDAAVALALLSFLQSLAVARLESSSNALPGEEERGE